MNKEIFKRRLRMVQLLAAKNHLNVVIATLSKEFGVTEAALYKDHQRMKIWAPEVEQHEQIATIIEGRIDLLNRESIDLITSFGNNAQLSTKEKFAKIAAIGIGLKATELEIKFAQSVGYLTCKPIEIQETIVSATDTPFEADPVLRQAIINSIEQQRAEKQAVCEALEKKKAQE